MPLYLFRNGNELVTDLPPEGHHPAMLTPIGTPTFPFPNLADHMIARVIASLPTN
ncbi:MAG TPA: hypothetical protein VJP80_08895 [Candidatus Saccharimonadales bacterium]|nr:hypothetical protein [Candidatus Saccharimonadales bacterium]